MYVLRFFSLFIFLLTFPVSSFGISDQELETLLDQRSGKSTQLLQEGRYQEMLQNNNDSYIMVRDHFGEDHLRSYYQLFVLSSTYSQLGDHVQSEEYDREVLRGYASHLGSDHLELIGIKRHLADSLIMLDRIDESIQLLGEIIDQQVDIYGLAHADVLIDSFTLMNSYKQAGRFAEAQQLGEPLLERSTELFGEENQFTLQVAHILGGVFEQSYQLDRAEELYENTFNTRRRVLGKQNEDTIWTAFSLGSNLREQGRYGDAEVMYDWVLTNASESLGGDHWLTLAALQSFAVMWQRQGQHTIAEGYHRQIVEASERTFGADNFNTLVAYFHLANSLSAQGKNKQAIQMMEKSVNGQRKILREDNPEMLSAKSSLADLYEDDDPGRSAKLHAEVLKTRERVLGETHPHTLDSVASLALLSFREGKYKQSLKYYQRALSARVQVLGDHHEDVFYTRVNLAHVLITLGDYPEGLEQLALAESAGLSWLAQELYTVAQEQFRRNTIANLRFLQDMAFSLALHTHTTDTVEFAANVLLRWKQVSGEEDAYMTNLVRDTNDATVRQLAEKIAAGRSELSRITHLPQIDTTKIVEVGQQLQSDERELAKHSQQFKSELASRNADWAAVHARLQQGGQLLEFRRYTRTPFDQDGQIASDERWLALLISSNDEGAPQLRLVDLGSAEVIDQMIAKLRDNYSKEVAAKLYSLLVGPLDSLIADAKTLYVAPDGSLGQLSFARLIIPDGRYWIERQQLRFILTGRDLLKSTRSLKGLGMVAFGGIDYDTSSAGNATIKDQTDAQFTNVSSRQLRGGVFQNLAYSLPEVEAVASYFSKLGANKPIVRQGKEASEGFLNSLDKPPRVLHLATHGFYFDFNNSRTNRPMTLSGLVLAGGNKGIRGGTDADGNDGILYALEAQNLNLKGTELVTMSACDTGRGTVDSSEGVYGLVRAFRVAGARNILMTLWPLNDKLAKEFMVDFYDAWLSGANQTAATALRQTQLKFANGKDEKKRDPQYWAPWVLVESN